MKIFIKKTPKYALYKKKKLKKQFIFVIKIKIIYFKLKKNVHKLFIICMAVHFLYL